MAGSFTVTISDLTPMLTGATRAAEGAEIRAALQAVEAAVGAHNFSGSSASGSIIDRNKNNVGSWSWTFKN
jgi:hypothetical protein